MVPTVPTAFKAFSTDPQRVPVQQYALARSSMGTMNNAVANAFLLLLRPHRIVSLRSIWDTCALAALALSRTSSHHGYRAPRAHDLSCSRKKSKPLLQKKVLSERNKSTQCMWVLLAPLPPRSPQDQCWWMSGKSAGTSRRYLPHYINIVLGGRGGCSLLGQYLFLEEGVRSARQNALRHPWTPAASAHGDSRRNM